VTTTEEHAMSYYDEYDDPRDGDDVYDAWVEAQHEKWADTATECGNCGELWQAGEHRATRIDPGYYEQPTCPRCGEWSIGDESPERDEPESEPNPNTAWIRDLFAEQFPADSTEEKPF
jgi:ribosomal protein S27AE